MKINNLKSYSSGRYPLNRKNAEHSLTRQNIHPSFGKNASNIVYSNIDKISDAIDSVLCKDNFFISNIEKAKKAGLDIVDNNLTIKGHTFIEDLCSTLKYPFSDMPFDIINSISKSLQKNKYSKISSFGEKIQNSKLFKEGIERAEGKKSYELIEKILEEFGVSNGVDSQKYINDFIESRAHKITGIAKNYNSRDERTLNRLVTGSIGAFLSSIDMYNISMLEKNDKNSANKAQKDRFQQEMARIGISAALTFITLGALDRYTKGKSLLTALIIAGSTLIAEVFSRVAKNKPLIPITPEQAKKIAQKQSKNNSTQIQQTNFQRMQPAKNDANGLYSAVIQNKSKTIPFTENKNQTDLKTNNNDKTNKQKQILSKFAIASAVASILYLASKALKGDYSKMLIKNKFLEEEKDKIQNYLSEEASGILDEKTVEEIKDIYNIKGAIDLEKLFKNFVEKFTTNTTEVNVNRIEREIDLITQTDEGKNLDAVLNVYRKQIDVLRQNNNAKFDAKVNKDIPAAIYEGFSKIFKTVYDFLAIPGEIIDKKIESHFKKSDNLFKDVIKKVSKEHPEILIEDFEKELSEFANILRKNEYKEYNYEKTIKHIKNHIKNFEKTPETGNLAHLTRTLVTFISSWFYVMDFRNSVLIESNGENIQRANEVTNDSIGYKASNFFFNGTLMNLANSIFKESLNNSLLAATIIPAGTEIANEFLIRKTIARPMHKLDSRDAVIEYERSRADEEGICGAWTRFYKKITGQKSLTEKYEAQKTNKS